MFFDEKSLSGFYFSLLPRVTACVHCKLLEQLQYCRNIDLKTCLNIDLKTCLNIDLKTFLNNDLKMRLKNVFTKIKNSRYYKASGALRAVFQVTAITGHFIA